MKTPYFVTRRDYIRDWPNNFFTSRDDAEDFAKERAYDKEINYVYELVSIINPPGPEPEIVIY